MPHDPLSDVLRNVRLRGAVFYYISLGDEWAAETPAAPALARALMPGAEHVLAYHLIVRGNGWAAIDGQPPVHMQAGDIVMFPRGDSHVLSSAPGLHASRADSDWHYSTRNDPKPIALAYHRGVLRPGEPQPADDAKTVVVCGFIGCDLRPFNPLIAALPRLLHLHASAADNWIGPILKQAVNESRQHKPGSGAVLDRVSEMVFVDAVRRHLESLPEADSNATENSWLAALRDPHVGRAISLLHAQCATPWTLEELGKQAGLSRSALHERFVSLVGQPPIQYLTSWRIQRSASLLRESSATVATIAQEVGYESEAAFSRAFKRMVGQPPATWRRAQKSAEPATKVS